jgi:hypothetical protein
LTDGLDEGVDKKQLGSSFGSKGNMMNTDETYKTPIEYYLEELKSTKDEFALDSHTDSVISFDGMLVFFLLLHLKIFGFILNINFTHSVLDLDYAKLGLG